MNYVLFQYVHREKNLAFKMNNVNFRELYQARYVVTNTE